MADRLNTQLTSCQHALVGCRANRLPLPWHPRSHGCSRTGVRPAAVPPPSTCLATNLWRQRYLCWYCRRRSRRSHERGRSPEQTACGQQQRSMSRQHRRHPTFARHSVSWGLCSAAKPTAQVLTPATRPSFAINHSTARSYASSPARCPPQPSLCSTRARVPFPFSSPLPSSKQASSPLLEPLSGISWMRWRSVA